MYPTPLGGAAASSGKIEKPTASHSIHMKLIIVSAQYNVPVHRGFGRRAVVRVCWWV